MRPTMNNGASERPSDFFKRLVNGTPKEAPQTVKESPVIHKTITTGKKNDIMLFVRLVQQNKLDIL